MNKYLVNVWVSENIWNHRSVWVEGLSFHEIQNMTPQEFVNSIYEFEDILDQEYGSQSLEELDMDSIELDAEHPDNIIPSDERPDVEDIDPNAGRGK